MKNTALWVLSILVGLNLILTLSLSVKLTGKTSKEIEGELANPLPSYVTKTVISDIGNKLIDAHNSRDIETEWNLYGEYAQAQMNKEKFSEDTGKVYDLFGPVLDIKYMYHEYAGKTGNLVFYNLFFKAKLTDHCQLSETATMKITIAGDGSDTQIVAFRMDSDS